MGAISVVKRVNLAHNPITAREGLLCLFWPLSDVRNLDLAISYVL